MLQANENTVTVQITDITDIRRYQQSTASATWANGKERDGWVLLAHFSPSHIDEKALVLYCSKENGDKALSNKEYAKR